MSNKTYTSTCAHIHWGRWLPLLLCPAAAIMMAQARLPVIGCLWWSGNSILVQKVLNFSNILWCMFCVVFMISDAFYRCKHLKWKVIGTKGLCTIWILHLSTTLLWGTNSVELRNVITRKALNWIRGILKEFVCLVPVPALERPSLGQLFR